MFVSQIETQVYIRTMTSIRWEKRKRYGWHSCFVIMFEGQKLAGVESFGGAKLSFAREKFELPGPHCSTLNNKKYSVVRAGNVRPGTLKCETKMKIRLCDSNRVVFDISRENFKLCAPLVFRPKRFNWIKFRRSVLFVVSRVLFVFRIFYANSV